MNSQSVALLKSPYFWAIIEWEMFPALTRGAKLVVASSNGHKSPEYLTNTIAAEEVSVLMITPQVMDLVLDVHDSQGNARPLRSACGLRVSLRVQTRSFDCSQFLFASFAAFLASISGE
eukprot:g32415.t1